MLVRRRSFRSSSKVCGGWNIADDTTIQYGGSVRPENTVDLMSQPHVDGALVGGASLAADSFIGIVRNTIQAKGLGDAGKKHGRR